MCTSGRAKCSPRLDSSCCGRQAEHRRDLVRGEGREAASDDDAVGTNDLHGVSRLKLAAHGGDSGGKQGRASAGDGASRTCVEHQLAMRLRRVLEPRETRRGALAGSHEQRADVLARDAAAASAADASTTGMPVEVAIDAASSLVIMPPVPTAEPRRETSMPSRSAGAVHHRRCGAHPACRARPCRAPSTSVSRTSASAWTTRRDERREAVVVAKANLVRRDRVVLVDDRHDAERQAGDSARAARCRSGCGAPCHRR